MDPDTYFNQINSLRSHAMRIRRKEDAEEQKLVEFLPVNERFQMGKESKVLTRWQERQKDWERIEQVINRKLSSKVARPLMMTTTDEFRSKIEEYDLIQAAIPLKDRYADSSWQMTLRGGGPIIVAIGHIFSGLECKIDPTLPKPFMVRKPKPPTAVLKNDTFLEESEDLSKKRKKYEKTIQSLRPHTMSYTAASHIVIRGVDLFQWAEESSLEHVKALRQSELDQLEASEESQSLHSLSQHETDSESLARENHPKLHFLSRTEVILDTVLGKPVQSVVNFKNIGATVLYYRWKKLIPTSHSSHGSKAPVTKAKGLDTILDEKVETDPAIRTRLLNKHRETFFCLQETGEILPNETITTCFLFQCEAGGGVFNSSWVLTLLPEETKIFSCEMTEEQALALASSHQQQRPVESGNSKIFVGSLTVNLHGHCIVPDDNTTRRNMLYSSIDQAATITAVQDVLYDCIRRVRIPIRDKDLKLRQRMLFAERNVKLFHTLFSSSTVPPPWLITDERLLGFENLHHEVHELFKLIMQQFHLTVSQLIDGETVSLDVTTVIDETILADQEKDNIIEILLPEGKLEIFDEISFDQIIPRWGYTITTAQATLVSLSQVTNAIEEMENVIRARLAKEEKERVRIAKRAARLAAGDSDAEDEDEEDEEEESPDDDEDGVVKVKPIHPLQQSVNTLTHRIHGSLLQLLTTTPPAKVIYDVTHQALCHVADGFDDCIAKAASAAGIAEIISQPTVSVPIKPMINPFTASEAFEAIMALTSSEPELAEKDKKKAAPKGKKDVLPTTLTAQQEDYYHQQLYLAVKESIVEALLDHVLQQTIPMITDSQVIEDSHRQLPDASITPSPQTLIETATCRMTDDQVEGKVIFLTFPAVALVNAKYGYHSAFNVASHDLRRLTQMILQLVSAGVRAVYLLCEYTNDENKAVEEEAWLAYQQALQQQWEQLVIKTKKACKKAKESVPSSYLRSLSPKMLASLPHVLHYASQNQDANNNNSEDQVPILLVQCLSSPGIVPPEPEYEEEDSDDESPAVDIGYEEEKIRRRTLWQRDIPHTVTVSMAEESVNCPCEASAAVRLLWQQVTANQPCLWIDGCTESLHNSQCILHKVHTPFQDAHVVTTPYLRETLLWAAIPSIPPLTKVPPPVIENGGEVVVSPVQQYLQGLGITAAQPKVMVILGGELRSEKIRLLDELIATVSYPYYYIFDYFLC